MPQTHARPGPRPLDTPAAEPLGWQVPAVDLIYALARHARAVVLIVGVAGAVAFWKLRTIVPEYTTTAVCLVLPREKAVFDASVETGSLESAEAQPRPGSASPFSLPPNVDLYVMLMKSRASLERVAAVFRDRLVATEGMPRDHRSVEQADFVRSMVSITGSEDGMISVVVTAKDKTLARDLANEISHSSDIEAAAIERSLLTEHANVLSMSAAAAEVQLESVANRIAAFASTHDLLDPSMQAQGAVDDLATLHGLRSSLDAEIEATRTRFREDSPIMRELRARREELDRRERQLKASVLREVPVGEYGRVLLEYRRLMQRFEFRQDLYLLLSSQAEIYRIRAQQAKGPVVVVRPAGEPLAPSGPSKKKTVIVPALLGVFLALGYALLVEQIRAVGGSPRLTGKLDDARRELLRAVPFSRHRRSA